MDEKKNQAVLNEIGKRLIELRLQKGYSSHESFAFDYDLPRIQYWRLEKGKANFTVKTLLKILSIHKITMEEFFTSNDNLPKKNSRSRAKQA